MAKQTESLSDLKDSRILYEKIFHILGIL